jgi:hypothetical protein
VSTCSFASCLWDLSIKTNSFDLDMPLEVDDEFWENDDPTLAFRQPPGKPSYVTAFNLWVKLTEVISFMMSTIVCQTYLLPCA